MAPSVLPDHRVLYYVLIRPVCDFARGLRPDERDDVRVGCDGLALGVEIAPSFAETPEGDSPDDTGCLISSIAFLRASASR